MPHPPPPALGNGLLASITQQARVRESLEWLEVTDSRWWLAEDYAARC